MPAGAIYVGRPGVWGNPFWHVEKFHGRERAVGLYRAMVTEGWNPRLIVDFTHEYGREVAEDFHEWLKRLGEHPVERAVSELRGHDLACWCRLDAPCHADVLLEVANA